MSRLDAQPVAGASKRRIAVVGAGAFGGWTALHLLNSGAQVVLIDAWGPGNTRSSSGGETRVIRAIYGPDRIYVEMVKRAYELWEKLDPSLYVETGALWMHRGDDAYVRSALPIMQELGFAVDQLSIDDAARQYPQIDFGGVKSVWFERRAGALSARRACQAVRDAFVKAGGTYRTGQVKPGSLTSLQLEDGSRIEADTYVFACGPWLGRLFPDVIGDRVRATRQEVFFFGTPPGDQRFTEEALPVWADHGRGFIYGIPGNEWRGFKVADDTRGPVFDPTTGERVPTPEGLKAAREYLAFRFPGLKGAPLVEARVCQYENSPDEHFIIDRHPAAPNTWLVGGGSGHGFKHGPAVGELVAKLVLGGETAPPEFRLSRLDPGARSRG